MFASPSCHCSWCTRGRWAQSCLRYQVEFLCPDSCASSATVCLWGRASTDTSSGPAGSRVLVGGLCRQLLESPECSWELGDVQGLLCFPGGLKESPNGSVGHD